MALSESMTYPMLSKLPPSSFVLQWKEIRPSNQPSGNVYSIGTGVQDVRFELKGAPNEFFLNHEMTLDGSVNIFCTQNSTGVAPAAALISDWLQGRVGQTPKLQPPIHLFDTSRESFNSGSLPYLEMSDPSNSHAYNELRYLLSPESLNPRSSESEGLQQAYWNYDLQARNGNADTDNKRLMWAKPTVLNYVNTIAGASAAKWSSAVVGKPFNFRIPLGTYSCLANSPSVLPVGLFSAYSTSTFNIDLRISSDVAKVLEVAGTLGGEDLNTDLDIRDLRLYVPVIKVLDEAAMDMVMSLYEKRQMVRVGGVEFPMSLRLNSIGYRLYNFPLGSGSQTDWFFRLPTTDVSVRGYAFSIINRTNINNGVYALSKPIRVTSLETHIGNEQIHPCVRDDSPYTSNVVNFLEDNIARVGGVFSPLPYYQEISKRNKKVSSINYYNQTNGNITTPRNLSASGTNNSLGGALECRSVCYGAVSFQNLDYREDEYNGNTVASGKNINNAGAIEVRMRIQQGQGGANGIKADIAQTNTIADVTSASKALTLDPIGDSDHSILFMVAYDNVLEVSPSGISTITNAVV